MRAHNALPHGYSKQAGNRWWDGYTTGQSVLLDDFRDTWWSLDYSLKLFDRYPIKVSHLFLSKKVTKLQGGNTDPL